MRIGVDWGGTKIEVIALDEAGAVLIRERTKTPRDDYNACIKTVAELISMVEARSGQRGSVGIGIPGTISPATGLVKNANSTWLNGKPLLTDMEAALARPVRIQNDANCFAVSEAIDGAGAGSSIVAGIILGTGCGAGIALDGKAIFGAQGIAGEFGHTPLPYMTSKEFPGNPCWCGKRGCLETYISGTGFQRDYETRIGMPTPLGVQEIIAFDDEDSRATYRAYVDRLARGLSTLINIVDPDTIVLGGGMSNIDAIYKDLPPLLADHIFSDFVATKIVKAKHGDSSGVRGAAWLWS
ncbi:MAG: ROK family protein [Hyphomicrobiales bacterium]